VTAWSLPLAFDLEVVASERVSSVRTSVVEPLADTGSSTPAPPSGSPLGFLIPWGSGAAATVAEVLREGIRVHSADEPFTHTGRRFDGGTAFIRLSENPQGSAARLQEVAQLKGAELVPINETWTEAGISLAGGRVAALKAPRVLLAWDSPTASLSAGWARYVLERRFGQRVTAMRVSTLQNFDMSGYDVLVLPSATYTFSEDVLRRLRDWIRNGGTLVTLAEASRWAARDRVGLLSTDTLFRDGSPERDPEAPSTASGQQPGSGGQQPSGGQPAQKPDPTKPFEYEKAIQPDRERPENLAGAMLRVRLDKSHWLTAGLDSEIQVVVEGPRVFAPLKLDAGRNVGIYQAADRLVAAGLVWKEAQPLLAQRAFLMHQPLGRGHIVAFAEDPNYRAFAEATELLFINAVLLSPAH